MRNLIAMFALFSALFFLPGTAAADDKVCVHCKPTACKVCADKAISTCEACKKDKKLCTECVTKAVGKDCKSCKEASTCKVCKAKARGKECCTVELQVCKACKEKAQKECENCKKAKKLCCDDCRAKFFSYDDKDCHAVLKKCEKCAKAPK